jgi:8-oxo-dGTP diphosphatase
MMQTHLVVLGLLQWDAAVLMVQQQGPTDLYAYWVLPGGLVAPGETLLDGLRREVREETGLHVTSVQQFVYCTQIVDPAHNRQTIAYLFLIDGWQGEFGAADPDGEILQVAWVPFAETVSRLEVGGWRGMREPLLSYLTGEAPVGSVWLYRLSGDEQLLEQRLP